jgi:hypothetical protein
MPVDRPDRTTIITAFTELVGCEVPIQLAGMGAASTAELAAAVSSAVDWGCWRRSMTCPLTLTRCCVMRQAGPSA